MYARDFIDAQESLNQKASTHPVPVARTFFTAMARTLSASVRFHLPYRLCIGDGRDISDLRPHFNLPFTQIAIHTLADTHIYGSSRGVIRNILMAAQETPGAEIVMQSVAKGADGWTVVAPGRVRAAFTSDGRLGFWADQFPGATHNPVPVDTQLTGFIAQGFSVVADLLLLLNLANVTTETVAPSKELAKARERRGKLPLLDYKVLRVGGELWHDERNHANTAEGEGYRSHMRRGHIRRIESGREVWVRSTYVQGRKDGFVAKEYHAHA